MPPCSVRPLSRRRFPPSFPQQRFPERFPVNRLQSRRDALDEKITELENLEIIGVVREVGMSPEQLAAFLHRNPAQSPLQVQEVTENG